MSTDDIPRGVTGHLTQRDFLVWLRLDRSGS